MKLIKEEVVTIEVLRLKGETNQAIAPRLGITVGAVRYHRRRRAAKARDGRTKLSLIEELQLVEVVDQWYADQLDSLPQGWPPNLHGLGSYLVDQYAFGASYKSVRKFVRDRFPAPDETALWMVNGDFYHDHRHLDHGSVILYPRGAPLSLDWAPLHRYVTRSAGR